MARGYFGIGVCHGKSKQNIGTLMRSAYCFGAAFVFTVGARYPKQSSDTVKSWRHLPLYHFNTVADLKAHLPHSCQLVGVELHERAKPLGKFSHPERACYLLGAEDHGLVGTALDACHVLVMIPGASRCLNVSVAGSIVLFDRTLQIG